MGIFDNSLVSGLIPSIFVPKAKSEDPGKNYVYQQQGGCGVKVYHQSGKTHQLFYEIQSCTVDRSTTDVAGSFQFTLAPTEPWDEIIRPDDYVRIFMGDQVSTVSQSKSAYNFASETLDHQKGRTGPGVVVVPLPGLGPVASGGQSVTKDSRKVAYLSMYERCVGKIDRVERMVSGPGPSAGQTIGFTVSGRGIGSIIQDTSLYYNEWLPGLNAINVFYGTKVDIFGSPDTFIKQILSVVLSAVPMPQWKIPDELIKDLNFPGQREANIALAQDNIAQFKKSVQAQSTSQSAKNIAGSANAITKLNQLLNEIEAAPTRSPFAILNLGGVLPCYGACLNKSFLNSTTTGLYEMVKGLSNDAFNEFFIDMCPAGNVNGGGSTTATPVPTIVLRQRPYNITDDMLKATPPMYADSITAMKDFSEVVLKDRSGKNISANLRDLMNSAITVFGPMQDPSASKGLEKSLLAKYLSSPGYTPMLSQYQVGISGHDRLNAFLVMGSFNSGQSTNQRALLAETGAFKINADSIRRYGMRVMELSTIYAQAFEEKDTVTPTTPFQEVLKKFSHTIANWYFMNNDFLNGRMICRFLPDARVGVPCKYIETRTTPTNPYPKMEISYVQGVTDEYTYGQPINTTLTVIRGIRYNLSQSDAGGLNSEIAQVSSLRERVAGVFSGLKTKWG